MKQELERQVQKYNDISSRSDNYIKEYTSILKQSKDPNTKIIHNENEDISV